VVVSAAAVSLGLALQGAVMNNSNSIRQGAGSMFQSLVKRAIATTVMVALLLPSLPSAVAASQPAAVPPRFELPLAGASIGPTLGDMQAAGAHYAQRWEKLSDLARQAQGQGSVAKAGPTVFRQEIYDVPRVAAEVLSLAKDLRAIGADLDDQFRRDEQYLRLKSMPEVFFDRLDKARTDFMLRREQLDDHMARLEQAQRIGNIDGQKNALAEFAKTVAAMPSAKSFIPMSREALAREGKIAAVRAPMEQYAQAKAVSEKAAPGPEFLAATDDAQITTKIREQAAALGNNPVAIFNWVRNNIDYLPTYGSIQGSELTRINRRGNAYDTASLLIAMLRAAGIPARYQYGTVDMPVAKAQNWLGGNIAPNQVVELMQKGGIPAKSVAVAGGAISTIRFEHIWVEAYVDFAPSRGGVNRTPSSWVPMDASFKKYEVHAPINISQGVPFNAQAVIAQADARTTKGQFGSVTGFDLTILNDAYNAYFPQAVDYVNQVKPNATWMDVRGYAAIVPSGMPILAGGLPFALVAKGNTYAALPDALRHIVKISYYASEADYSEDLPEFSYSMPLAKVGISTIGIDYAGASQADRDLLAQLQRDNAASFSPYLINVVPQVQIEGQAVASGNAVQMGTVQYWKADISDPHGIYPPTIAGNRTLAGSRATYVFDPAGMSTDVVQKRLDLIPDGVSLPVRETLQQAGMHFWMLRETMDANWASQFAGKVVRLPSVGAFSTPLQVTFAFGVARSGSFGPFQTDIKRNLYAAVNDTQAHQLQMFTAIGTTGSLLEATVWEMLLGLQLGSGVSAAKVLAVANDRRIPVYMVDATNVGSVLPLLQVTADTKQEIQNAIAAGNRVVVPEREVTIGKWSGIGYVIQDPVLGTGVYQIDGGLSGAEVAGCAVGFLANVVFGKLLAKYVNQFAERLLKKGLARSALLAGAGAMFPIAAAVVGQFMWWLSFQAALIDFVEMMATATPEQLLGAALAAVCSRLDGGCGGGGPRGGNPVDFATGEKYQLETDYTGAGDNPLVLQRVYISSALDTGTTSSGQKWRHTYERSIYVPPPDNGVDANGNPLGNGYVITEDTGSRAAAQVAAVPPRPNAVVVFRPNADYYQFNYRSGRYTANANVVGTLSRQTDAAGNTTGWVYLNEKDEIEQYDADGALLSITTRAGMTQTLSYDANGFLTQVRDHFGRTLGFTYNASGDVDTITDPAGGVLRYGYDEARNLVSVQYPDQKVRRYHYEQGLTVGLLTGITDENGNRFATYKYDFNRRVIDETHAGGADHITITYDSDLVSHVTDALGTTRTYEFRKVFDDKYLAKVTEPCTSGCANGGVALMAYDAQGFVSSRTDFNGNQTVQSNNARGLEISRTEALGSPVARTIATEYDPQWRVPTKITEPTSAGSRITTFTLDARGNVRSKTVTVGTESRTWAYTYNDVGQLLTMDGPRTDVNDVETRTYVGGNLETVTDAAGNVTRYANYDSHGRAQQVTDPNGLITTLTYDARGRLKTSNAGGETTTYDYDGVGNLSKLTLPDASFLSFGYDAAERLTSITDSLGNSVVYTLDNVGNRTKEETKDPGAALAQTIGRVFDGLSRMKQMLGAANQTTAYTYDSQGNAKSTTDPLAHVTANDYDALNRLVKVTEPQLRDAPAAGTIGYGYDAQDNLTSVTDQRGLVTSYGYTGFDELRTLTSPDTGVTQYTYDAAGNVKTVQDARGQGATYSYDALNRLKSLLYSDESLAFTYDDVTVAANSKGRLSKVTDGSGSTTYAYDVQGRVTGKTQVTGAATLRTGYTYNPAGQLASIQTPSNQSIAYGYTNNQITSITVNGVPLVANAKYFPFGEVQKWTWGNGQGYERVYDLDGRIKSVTLAGVVRGYGFDDASRITAMEDKQGATSVAAAAFGYDNLDHLSSAVQTGGNAFNQAFAYDVIGNRLSSAEGGQTTPYTYAPSSNRLTKVGTVDIGYDAVGNTTSDGNFAYTYSGRNRLVEVKQGASSLASYKHNAFGERVQKTVGGAAHLFYYDEDGHLLGEYDAAGALIQETVWLDDTPVATLRPKSSGGVEIDYVWADHLDTPRAVTTSDAAGTVLWQWKSDPFGTTAATGSIEYNLRFPGQYFDAETELHYNYFREYDPASGRYREADPSGLWGGTNRYQYANLAPTAFFDDEAARAGSGRGGIGGSGRGGGSGRSAKGAAANGMPNCGGCSGHKNSNDYEGLTHVYEMRGPNGEIHKIGKGSGEDAGRCEKQARKLNRTKGGGYSCQIRRFFCGTQDATNYETRLQDKLRGLGNSLPGNAPRPNPR
jgi:RHS repeat-associated protein